MRQPLNKIETDPSVLAGILQGVLTPEAKKQFYRDNRLIKYKNDPVGFGEEILGETYTEDIKKLMRSVLEYPITVGMSATGPGKTHSSGAIAIWFYKVFAPDVQVYTVAAPPESNLKTLLWGEIGSRVRKHPNLFKEDAISIMNIVRHDKSFIRGLTIPTTGSEDERVSRFSGKHAPYILFVVDEADAVPDAVYRGIEGCMSGGMARLLLMFNPKRQAGKAYDYIKKRKANVVHLTAFGHPNVITGRDVIPGAVDRDKTLKRIHEMTEQVYLENEEEAEQDPTIFKVPDFLVGTVTYDYGKNPYPPLEAGYRKIIDSQFYYQVLGIYPASGSNKLIPTDWLNRARSNWDLRKAEFGVKPPKGTKPIVGFDVADEGEDSNALCYRYGNFVDRLQVWKADVLDSIDKAAFYLEGKNPQVVFVDKNGLGASVPKSLKRKGIKAKGIMVQESPEKDDKKIKAEFNKLRDQLWWEVREWLKNPGAMLPPDEMLFQELDMVEYEENLRGKIQVTSKDKLKKPEFLGRSPDRADALCLTFAKKEGRPRVRSINLYGD